MTTETRELVSNAELHTTWGFELEDAICEHCDWSFLIPKGTPPQRCPHCFQADLSVFEGDLDELPYAHPPELLLPFRLSPGALAQKLQAFAQGVWFAPSDLNPQNLQARLRRILLPMWLVDAEVQATWQAEAGFDYEVVSHQDRYEQNRGGWTSQQVKEGRIRWEARAGRLRRAYQNVSAPALEEDAPIKRAVGKYSLENAEPYRPELVKESFVRLPNRTPQDAWSEAAPAFQAAAGEECRQAAGADHIRQFQWQAEYSNQNWTLLLQPLYSTYYLDDEQKPQRLFIHGQTGQLSGTRRASMKRAKQASLVILAIAILLFIFSLVLSALGVMLPVLLPLGGLGIVFALLVGLAAIIPLGMAWQVNRSQ